MQERREEAVSAVLATVLLIGIAIALAAAVFVAVQVLTDDREVERKPAFAITADPNEPSMKVVRAEDGLTWDDLHLGGTCMPELNGGPFPPPPGTLVQAGDVIACSAGDTLLVSIREDSGNALLLDHRFPG
jgi:hypothetical protein